MMIDCITTLNAKKLSKRKKYGGSNSKFNCTFNFEFYSIKYISYLPKELCTEELVTTDCGAMTLSHRTTCIYLFIIAQCLHGITGMPLYILGVTFIYDHIPTFSAGVYVGKFVSF